MIGSLDCVDLRGVVLDACFLFVVVDGPAFGGDENSNSVDCFRERWGLDVLFFILRAACEWRLRFKRRNRGTNSEPDLIRVTL